MRLYDNRNRMSRFDKQCAFRIPGEMKAKIKQKASARMMDEADIVREALREYFERDESAVASAPAPQEVAA